MTLLDLPWLALRCVASAAVVAATLYLVVHLTVNRIGITQER